MSGKRSVIRASEFCSSVRDGTHDSPKSEPYGHKLITSRHLKNGRIHQHEAYAISDDDYAGINKRSKVDKWDVLISMIGTIGEVCLVKEEPEFAIKNVGLFKTKSENDGKWLYYYLLTRDAQNRIAELSRGTTQQYLPLSALRDLPILCCDSLSEQSVVVSILSTLDDKIELNRKMNETLEQMARALFKSWFVDFDPVRAKMEGRTPTGMDAATAALFPDRLVDSELGPIPEGWEVKALGEVMDIARQSINPAAQPSEVFTHYSLPAFDTGRVPVRQRGDEIKSNKLLLTEGSVLISKLNPHLPRVWLPTLDPTELSVCSTEFIVAIASPSISKEYLYCLLCSGDFQQTYQGLATGTTGSHQRIQAESLLSLSQVVAPEDVVAMFTLNLKSMIATVNHNIHQSRTLSTLRDTLLPKLVGGEVRV